MKEEIKEILDELESMFEISELEEQVNNINKIRDYITNLQEIAEEHKNCTKKHWQQKCAEHCANEMIYKQRNEKAIYRLQDIIESNNGALSNPEHSIIGKHLLLKLENDNCYNLLNILKGDKDE